MKIKLNNHASPRWRALVSGVLIVAVCGGAGAYAATASHAQGPTAAGRSGILGALTAGLGIDAQQLRADLGAGQTFAQIAAADGTSAAALDRMVLGAVQSRLERAVAAGKLTTPQEQTRLARTGTAIGKLLNVSHPLARLQILRWRTAVLRVAAEDVGVSPQQLRFELRSGTSLAQIALANGKTASQLEAVVVSAATARLDRAVSAGTITSARAQTLILNLQQRLDTFVNHSVTPSG